MYSAGDDAYHEQEIEIDVNSVRQHMYDTHSGTPQEVLV